MKAHSYPQLIRAGIDENLASGVPTGNYSRESPGESFKEIPKLTHFQTEILGIKVPAITIPVMPGRNLASIVEVAAMNNRNRKMGHNAALELTQRMDRHFEKIMENEGEN